jgi:hypothetical protein
LFDDDRRRAATAGEPITYAAAAAVVGDVDASGGTRAALTEPIVTVRSSASLQQRPESALALRRVLHEARNALLDKRDVSGPLAPIDQAQLREIDTELEALAAAEVRRLDSQNDVWAKITALANRIVAIADVDHDPQ